ncbi:MAG TPA: hypothetical protein VI636_13845 [Candidatus Angelobacter sp.]
MSITDLPLDKGSRIYKVFERLGLLSEGLSEKNHYILTDPNTPYLYLSIPNHRKVDRNTLRAEIRKWARANNIQNGDQRFCEAYDQLYGTGEKPKAEVHEMEQCSMCREIIKPEDETVIYPECSGVKVHKTCHEKNIGSAPAASS